VQSVWTPCAAWQATQVSMVMRSSGREGGAVVAAIAP
jgi:hypothetical protein